MFRRNKNTFFSNVVDPFRFLSEKAQNLIRSRTQGPIQYTFCKNVNTIRSAVCIAMTRFAL